jgi:hypothetical protein
MARIKKEPIVEKSRESFKVGQYNNPLKGIKDKEQGKTQKWMETHKA